jgi:hypothetical protein
MVYALVHLVLALWRAAGVRTLANRCALLIIVVSHRCGYPGNHASVRVIPFCSKVSSGGGYMKARSSCPKALVPSLDRSLGARTAKAKDHGRAWGGQREDYGGAEQQYFVKRTHGWPAT